MPSVPPGSHRRAAQIQCLGFLHRLFEVDQQSLGRVRDPRTATARHRLLQHSANSIQRGRAMLGILALLALFSFTRFQRIEPVYRILEPALCIQGTVQRFGPLDFALERRSVLYLPIYGSLNPVVGEHRKGIPGPLTAVYGIERRPQSLQQSRNLRRRIRLGWVLLLVPPPQGVRPLDVFGNQR